MRLMALARAVVLMLVAVVPVQADMFDDARKALNIQVGRYDTTGHSIRGGINYQTGTDGRTVTLFRGQATASGGCSLANWAESMKDAFEEIPGIIQNAGQALIQSTPMLALCYGFPTLCDAVKHWQAIMNTLIQFRYASCQQMQTAMAYLGSRLAQGEQSKCLDYQVNSLGYPINKAMTNCLSTVSLLTGPDGQQRTDVNLIEDGLRYAGASPEVIQVANGLLGEIRFSAQGGRLGVRHEHRPSAVYQRYEYYRAESDKALQAALQELRDTGTVSDATLQSVSVPGQPVPMVALEGLHAMQKQPLKQQALTGKLATATALQHLTWECQAVREELAAAMDTNSQYTDAMRNQLKLKLEQLERDLNAVYARIKPAQEYYQPAVEEIQREYARQQATAGEYAIQAPAPVQLTLPFGGRQTPVGNSR